MELNSELGTLVRSLWNESTGRLALIGIAGIGVYTFGRFASDHLEDLRSWGETWVGSRDILEIVDTIGDNMSLFTDEIVPTIRKYISDDNRKDEVTTKLTEYLAIAGDLMRKGSTFGKLIKRFI